MPSSGILPTSSETRFLIGQTGWPASPRDALVSSSPVLELQTHATMSGIFTWGFNSGLLVCKATALLTEPSPQPLESLLSER